MKINKVNDELEATGYWEEYYHSGKLAAKGNYINGKKEGTWEEYFGSGRLLYKQNYINGIEYG